MPSGKAIYRQRDVLLTKFPFSDLQRFKVRPVLVLSNDADNRRFADLVICAITSALRPHPYAAKVGSQDLEEGLLKVESQVRADTITSLEQQIVLKRIGRLRKETYRGVIALIQKLIHAG
jgi:mRNA interferase MazF